MSIDLHALHKLESTSLAQTREGWAQGERRPALIHLRPGHALPEFVVLRAKLSERMCSADVGLEELVRLEADERVESVALSRPV